MEKLVIAPHQLFCILFISRVLSSILYSPVIQPSLEPIGYIFGSIIGILLQLVLLVPLMFYMQLSENQPFSISSFCSLGKIGPIIVVLYVLFCLVSAVGSLSEISFFMATFTREYSMLFYLVVASVVGFYVAYSGIQCIARIGFLFAIGLVVSLLIAAVGGFSHINIYSIVPVYQGNISQIWSGLSRYLSNNSDFVLLVLLAPYVKTGVKKLSILAVAATGIVSAFAMFVSAGVLGTFFNKLAFPYYTMFASMNLFGIRRLDVIQLYFCFLLYILKFSVLIFAGARNLENLFPIPKRKPVFWIFCIVVFVLALAVGISDFKFVPVQLSQNLAVSILLLTIIPSAMAISLAIKKRKRGERK